MKTLYAKGALLVCFVFFGIPSVIVFLLEIHVLWEGDMGTAIPWMLNSIWFLLLGVFSGKVHCTHWIKYGNGKVVIRRVSKECVNGRPVGKWESREDTFLLEEIEAYGLSKQALGDYVERHRCTSYKCPAVECFFRLKNGKIIGCEIGYYPRREIEEFFRYLHEKTGISFQKERALI